MPWRPYRRFIPVLTGNTFALLLHFSGFSVHPRAYGEHDIAVLQEQLDAGSSPCLRGTPNPATLVFTQHRFIPVLTGNTKEGFDRKASIAVHPRAYGEHSVKKRRAKQ